MSPKKASAPEARASSSDSDIGFDGGVEADFFVDLLLDVAKLRRIDGSEVGEIKTQALGRVQRAGLLDVGAENIAQRGVDQVRAAVIAHDVGAAFGIGDDGDAIADVKSLFGDDTVSDQSCDGIVRAVTSARRCVPALS